VSSLPGGPHHSKLGKIAGCSCSTHGTGTRVGERTAGCEAQGGKKRADTIVRGKGGGQRLIGGSWGENQAARQKGSAGRKRSGLESEGVCEREQVGGGEGVKSWGILRGRGRWWELSVKEIGVAELENG